MAQKNKLKSVNITSVDQSFNKRPSQKRLLHSDSTISYQIDNLPNSYTRNNDSNNGKELLTRNVSYLNNDDIETSTSRSIVHGLILVAIMITSLVAFVCSKVRRCSNYINFNDYEHCSKYFLFYSSMTIISCLVTFIIYFIHLISQCDFLCLNKKKYEFEIMFISIVSCLLVLSSICYMSHTNIFAESFTLVSFIFSSLSNVLYWIRIAILIYEMVNLKKRSRQTRVLLKRSYNLDQQQQQQQQQQQSIRFIYPNTSVALNIEQNTTNKVVSYVRNKQRSKTLSTSLSDDFEDDVFIQ